MLFKRIWERCRWRMNESKNQSPAAFASRNSLPRRFIRDRSVTMLILRPCAMASIRVRLSLKSAAALAALVSTTTPKRSASVGHRLEAVCAVVEQWNQLCSGVSENLLRDGGLVGAILVFDSLSATTANSSPAVLCFPATTSCVSPSASNAPRASPVPATTSPMFFASVRRPVARSSFVASLRLAAYCSLLSVRLCRRCAARA